MRTFLSVVILALAACGHVQSKSPVPAGSSGGPVGAAPKGQEAAPSEPLPSLSGLRLGLRQLPSTSDVALEVALTNAGTTSVRITTNARFAHRRFDGHREAEIEIQLLDARGRLIPFQCSDCRFGLHIPEVSPLQPGQTRAFTLSLAGGCYDLVPGEHLSFIATYANLFSEDPIPTTNVPDVQPSDWLSVVVPTGWSSGGAAQPGVAADGAARRR